MCEPANKTHKRHGGVLYNSSPAETEAGKNPGAHQPAQWVPRPVRRPVSENNTQIWLLASTHAYTLTHRRRKFSFARKWMELERDWAGQAQNEFIMFSLSCRKILTWKTKGSAWRETWVKQEIYGVHKIRVYNLSVRTCHNEVHALYNSCRLIIENPCPHRGYFLIKHSRQLVDNKILCEMEGNCTSKEGKEKEIMGVRTWLCLWLTSKTSGISR